MKSSRRLKLSIREAVTRRFGEDGLATFEAWSQLITHYRRRLFPSNRDPEIAYLPRIVNKGDVCLDIGANVGIFTAHLSRLVGDSGCVHSFEPVGFTFSVLSRFVGLLRLRNVRLHHTALGDADGEVEMEIPALKGASLLYDMPSARLRVGQEMDVRLERVLITTLDAFLPNLGDKRVSFVKCDAEGAELSIFRGGVEFFRRHAPVVLCEVAARHTERYGYLPADILKFFTEMNYVGCALENGRLRPVDGENLPNGNYWFIRTSVAETSEPR